MSNLPLGPHRIEEMLSFCLETARKLLEAHGAFFPFAAVIEPGGNRRTIVPEAGEDRTTSEAYTLLQTSMRQSFKRGEIIAGAIVALAGIPPEFKPEYPEGIRVTVESASIARLVFLPYRASPLNPHPTPKPGPHNVVCGELLGVNVKPTIFPAQRKE